jgi:pimeloyl-ACP methyl ester carboxylesterase
MNDDDIERYRAAEHLLWNLCGASPSEHRCFLPRLGVSVRLMEIGSGPPLLFVHGSPSAGSVWAPLAAALSDHRCLILDRPGCGLSGAIDYDGINLRRFGALLIEEVLDSCNVRAAALVASSLGGALAFYFAETHPDRLNGLVIEGCPAFVQGFHVPLNHIVSSVGGMLFGATMPALPSWRHRSRTDSSARSLFEQEVFDWRDVLFARTDTTRNEGGLTKNITLHFRDYGCGPDVLRHLSVPTLYLWGTEDPFGDISVGQACAGVQVGSELRVFAGAGHLPWLGDPFLHARFIREFLESRTEGMLSTVVRNGDNRDS